MKLSNTFETFKNDILHTNDCICSNTTFKMIWFVYVTFSQVALHKYLIVDCSTFSPQIYIIYA